MVDEQFIRDNGISASCATRIADLQCKEVVNLCTGCRMGFVNDVEVDVNTGRVVAIVVPAGRGLLGALFHKEEHVIPWGSIEKIGADIIIVRCTAQAKACRKGREKHRFF